MRGTRLVGGAVGAALLLIAPLMATAQKAPRLEARILSAHNAERFRMGVPALQWSWKLAADAKVWADFLARTGRFEHSAGLGSELQGENIWMGTAGYFQPEAMFDLWLAEKRDYVAGVYPANSRTGRAHDVGHYTQIIWRDTSAVGCAISRGYRNDVLVCRYTGPGNVRGQRPI